MSAARSHVYLSENLTPSKLALKSRAAVSNLPPHLCAAPHDAKICGSVLRQHLLHLLGNDSQVLRLLALPRQIRQMQGS